MKGTVSLFCFCLAFVFPLGRSQTCSNKCTQKEKTLDQCWNPALTYFQQTFTQALETYMAVASNIDQWHSQHNSSHANDLSDQVQQAADYMYSFVQNSPSPVSYDVLVAVLRPVLNQTLLYANETTHSHNSSYTCDIPGGCPKAKGGQQIWKYVAIASLAINAALVVATVPSIVRVEWRDRKIQYRVLAAQKMPPAAAPAATTATT